MWMFYKHCWQYGNWTKMLRLKLPLLFKKVCSAARTSQWAHQWKFLDLGFSSWCSIVYKKQDYFWNTALPWAVTWIKFPSASYLLWCSITWMLCRMFLCTPCISSYLLRSFTKAKCSSAAILLSSLAFSSSQVERKASNCFWYPAISSSWLCFFSSKITICLVNFEAFGMKKQQN